MSKSRLCKMTVVATLVIAMFLSIAPFKAVAAEKSVKNQVSKLAIAGKRGKETTEAISFQWSSLKDNKRTLKVEIIDSDPRQFAEYALSRGPVQGKISGKVFNKTFDFTGYSYGSHFVKFTLDDGVTFNVPFEVVPQKIKLNKSKFKTFHNSIASEGFKINGDYAFLAIRKKGDEWNNNGYKISSYQITRVIKDNQKNKLKPDTEYEMVLVCVAEVKEDGKTKTYFSYPSNIITLRTGKGEKLPVKSVKITNLKVKRGWQPGRWVGHTWHSGHYWVASSYTATIYMSKKPGVKGIVVNGTLLKGNKMKYKLKQSVSGLVKGKKVTFDMYGKYNNDYGSFGKKTVKKALVR